jgi:uncharacterized protein YaaR (DUF327 family)
LKIQQNLGLSQNRFFSARERGKDSLSFQQIFQDNQLNQSQDRVQSLIKDLEQQGTRLSRSRSIKDLMEYKQTIRNFLNEVVQNGLSVEDHTSHLPNGREKRLKMIKQVDQRLLELSEQVIEKQAPTVDLLQKIGEIKGLLVNLYL